MIRNPDGSPYCTTGSLQQFDPNSSDHDLFNIWDAEIIRISGSPIYYYEVFIQSQTVHPLYLEDRGKLWSASPIQIWALYEPVANLNDLTRFGIDAPDEMIFDTNYREVLSLIGHPPKVGSLLFTPHKQEMWEIKQRNDGEFKKWGQLRLQLICTKYQGSITDNSGAYKKPTIDKPVKP